MEGGPWTTTGGNSWEPLDVRHPRNGLQDCAALAGGMVTAGGAGGAVAEAGTAEAEEPAAEGRAAEETGQLTHAEYGGGGSLQFPAGAPECPKAVPG